MSNDCPVCSEPKCDKPQCIDRLKSKQVLESVDELIKQLYP